MLQEFVCCRTWVLNLAGVQARLQEYLNDCLETFSHLQVWKGKVRRKSRREKYLITSYCALTQFEHVFISKVNIFNLDLLNHI